MYTKRNPDRIKVTSMMLARDVEALMDGRMYAGDLWIRLSKGKSFLCICDGYRIVKTLCYVGRENLQRFLYASSDEECIEIANSLSNKFKIWSRTSVEGSIEDYGVEAKLAEKETWGDEYRIDEEELEGYEYWINLIETWGVGALREEADPETIKELYRMRIISREDYKWLTGEKPED